MISQEDGGVKDEITLSPREQSVLRLIAFRHASDKTVSRLLDISPLTAKSYVRRLMDKTGQRNREDLAVWGSQHPEALRGEPATRLMHEADPNCLCPHCVHLT